MKDRSHEIEFDDGMDDDPHLKVNTEEKKTTTMWQPIFSGKQDMPLYHASTILVKDKKDYECSAIGWIKREVYLDE